MPWALDSGGFTELLLHGEWQTTPATYVADARRLRDAIGLLAFAAPQDWMCEPSMLRRTGLSVAEHQERTVTNYLSLRELAPDVPWMPVLQGWAAADYFRCIDRYSRAGVDLLAAPRVGLGTVCRRQHTAAAADIVSALAATGLRLHAFGFKVQGLVACASALASADSMAWSLDARRMPALPACRHRQCSNCLPYADAWRARLLGRLCHPRPMQSVLVL